MTTRAFRHTAATHPKDAAVRRALGHAHPDLALQGRNGKRCAQGEFVEADRNGDREIVAVTTENLVRSHVHGDVQVARGGAPQTGLALAGQPDPLTVLDAGWDPHVDGASPGRRALAAALLARLFDDRARAPAFGARFGESERALVAADYAGAVAVRAHLRAGTRARTAAMAVGTRRRAGEPQRHRHALGGLEEGQRGLGLEIVAATGTAGPRLLSTAAEQITDVGATGLAGRTEQVTEVDLAAVATEAAEVSFARIEATPESTVGEKPSGFVVLLLLGRIRQHAVGFGYGLEPLLRCGVARIPVGVQLRGQLAVGLLDLRFGGVRGDAELLVEVLLDPFALGHVASPPHLCSSMDYSFDSAFALAFSPSLPPVSSTVSDSGTVSITPTMACRRM